MNIFTVYYGRVKRREKIDQESQNNNISDTQGNQINEIISTNGIQTVDNHELDNNNPQENNLDKINGTLTTKFKINFFCK